MSRNYKFHNPDGVYFVSFAVVEWIEVFKATRGDSCGSGGKYGNGGADFMHFEVKPAQKDRFDQAALQSLDITKIKEYLNSFRKIEGKENYSY